MSALTRSVPAAPVRHVHLGLGNFFRAHQAWYNAHAPDAAESVHTIREHGAWLTYLADPMVQVVTTTVTEAGYVRGTDGGLDADRTELREDVAALRARHRLAMPHRG